MFWWCDADVRLLVGMLLLLLLCLLRWWLWWPSFSLFCKTIPSFIHLIAIGGSPFMTVHVMDNLWPNWTESGIRNLSISGRTVVWEQEEAEKREKMRRWIRNVTHEAHVQHQISDRMLSHPDDKWLSFSRTCFEPLCAEKYGYSMCSDILPGLTFLFSLYSACIINHKVSFREMKMKANVFLSAIRINNSQILGNKDCKNIRRYRCFFRSTHTSASFWRLRSDGSSLWCVFQPPKK